MLASFCKLNNLCDIFDSPLDIQCKKFHYLVNNFEKTKKCDFIHFKEDPWELYTYLKDKENCEEPVHTDENLDSLDYIDF